MSERQKYFMVDRNRKYQRERGENVGITKYQQVINWIEERIQNGTFKVGDRLDSEHDMSQYFGMSRQTVRHAIFVLQQKGVLESRQGSGNYIRAYDRIASRAKRQTKTIVIVSTYVNNYIFPRTIQGMESVLDKADYRIRIMFTHNQREEEKKILKRLLVEGNIDGLIIEPVKSALPNPNETYYQQLQEQQIPILLFNSFYENCSIPYVSLNDIETGKKATEYLIKQGHRKIGGIFKFEDGQGTRRYQGYLSALESNDIPLREKHIIWVDTEEQKNLQLSAEKILNRLRGCSACVCYNDEVAYELSKICRNARIKIPEELSLISIDNSELAKLNIVPLTSISHPMEKLGVKVAEHLLKMIEDSTFDISYEFEPELNVRNSVQVHTE